jgi:hypothetical protein
MVEVTLSGYVRDELSIARDGGGIGISDAYLMVNGEETIPLVLGSDGSYSLVMEFEASKGVSYTVEPYAFDTNPDVANGGQIDQTCVRVPSDMSNKVK